MDRLVWSRTIMKAAQRVRDDVERVLLRQQIPGEVVVTGPASLPGVLTKGDLDLHLRVPVDRFEPTVDRLREVYAVASRDAWAPTLAVFAVPAREPAGLAVTPIASAHDQRFTVAWQRLRAEPELRRRYNSLKSEAFGTDYEAQKSAFFDEITGGSSRGP